MTIFVHRIDESNPGDYWSCPSHYFSFSNIKEFIDIRNIKGYKTNDTIIFGGGGLLGRVTWDNNVEQLVKNNKVVLWGAGQNVYGQKKKGDMIGIPVKSQVPDYIKDFDLIGLRDYNLGYDWVPCASCMHDIFLKAKQIKPIKDILGIEHNKIKLRSDYFSTINHNISINELEDFILKIAEYKSVITNTYHGAYWSLLLGKKVLIQPWSSKFNNLKWNTGIIGKNEQTQKTIFDKLEMLDPNNQNALDEARSANIQFYQRL